MLVGFAEDLERDDGPPPSGPRLRVPASLPTPEPSRSPEPEPVAVPPAPPAHALPVDPEILAEVVEDVCVEVWGVTRALAPLQGAWLTMGLAPLGATLLTMARWRHEGHALDRKTLRARWPELVPGHAAMGCLVGLMVDRRCH